MSNEAWSRAKERKYSVVFLFGAMDREAKYSNHKKKKKKKQNYFEQFEKK